MTADLRARTILVGQDEYVLLEDALAAIARARNPHGEPRRQHTHPLDGAVAVVHSRTRGPLDDGTDNPAHAFAFPSEAAAIAFEAKAEDDCHKVILDLFIPDLADL